MTSTNSATVLDSRQFVPDSQVRRWVYRFCRVRAFQFNERIEALCDKELKLRESGNDAGLTASELMELHHLLKFRYHLIVCTCRSFDNEWLPTDSDRLLREYKSETKRFLPEIESDSVSEQPDLVTEDEFKSFKELEAEIFSKVNKRNHDSVSSEDNKESFDEQDKSNFLFAPLYGRESNKFLGERLKKSPYAFKASSAMSMDNPIFTNFEIQSLFGLSDQQSALTGD